nr:NDP-hexose 2,3-dehydratase family protein [Streptomyces taklimakanensis]
MLREARGRVYTRTERVPLAGLDGWHEDPATGSIRHRSGGFFSVEGVGVRRPGHPVPHWEQPIINQPEIGLLGLLVKDFGGVPHCLVQLKAEPGNRNGIQLSPTVQATASNYRRVHGGSPVPYLEYFAGASPVSPASPRRRVVADVRQSEQGAWFLRKRNRNMVVEVTEEVEVREGFLWLTLTELHGLLAVEDLVNMDTRSVLACLPSGPAVAAGPAATAGPDDFAASVVRSGRGDPPALHPTEAVLSWITDARVRTELEVRPRRLDELARWRYDEEGVSHDSGRFFSVIGVRVEASGREVNGWSQPMLAPHGTGIVAFLVTRVAGVLHVLAQVRAEPGYADVAELAPTVQCVPENYDVLPPAARPAFLDDVLGADPADVRFDTVLSEEGGRFYHARTRHLVVETPHLPEPPDFRWLTLRQFSDLLRHSHYVSMEARSLLACLRSLAVAAREPDGVPS